MNVKSTCIKAVKYIALWFCGYLPTRWAFNAIKKPIKDLGQPLNLANSIVKHVSDVRAEVKSANALSEMDDRALWDDMCREYEITTKSVQFKYKIALILNFCLVMALALIVGNLFATYKMGGVMIYANIIYFYVVLMFLVQNAYRMHMARTQSAPKVSSFIVDAIKNPSLLIGRPLPKDYRVRLESYV
ncbi:hypothetical protein [Stutzerimonas nitrititolerans]|uniref:hypothetical protein n=1 Tax=Stutzerimonas nitrititolerans TaxID=2482751 RepID=UPI00289DD9C7|nr:hypothetical protein [Stutzerimonas nitrititolerans]